MYFVYLKKKGGLCGVAIDKTGQICSVNDTTDLPSFFSVLIVYRAGG